MALRALERLRDGLAQNSGSQSHYEAQVASASNASSGKSCAKVPLGVPLLPNDYQETETVLLMRQILLQSRDDPQWTRRCGFYTLHNIEEECRRFRGEGKFSFPLDLPRRVHLLHQFLERIK